MIALLLIFLLCGGIGVIYVLDLMARRRQMVQMLEWIRFLRREIRCESASMSSLLRKKVNTLPLLQALECREPFDLAEAYERAKIVSQGEMLFGHEEWNATDELFRSMGIGDVTEQENRLSLCEGVFLRSEESAREALGKNGKPALVLGCSVGAVLVLMLI